MELSKLHHRAVPVAAAADCAGQPTRRPGHGVRLRRTLTSSTAQVMMITPSSAGGESTASLIGSAAWVLAAPSRYPTTGARSSGAARCLSGRGIALRAAVSGPLPPRRTRHHTVRCGTSNAGARLLLFVGGGPSRPLAFRRSKRIPTGPSRWEQIPSLLARERTSASEPH